MKPLHYSSAPDSELNDLRRNYWTAKYMLACANREPKVYTKSLWMGNLNTARAELGRYLKRIENEDEGVQGS